MRYPDRVIKMGDSDARVVSALKNQLNKKLALTGDEKLTPDNPVYGRKVKEAVQLFQARNVDDEGRPLKIDGEVGAVTWARLFGENTVPSVSKPADKFLGAVLAVALAEEAKKVRELPGVKINRGPEVEKYQASIPLAPGSPWCCAFTYWCFEQAAKASGRANPSVKTGLCLAHWNRAESKGAQRISAADAVNNPALLKPGMIFIQSTGGGRGHTGFIVAVHGGMIDTVEGNTNGGGSREGDGIYRRVRKLTEVNKGYIDYSGV